MKKRLDLLSIQIEVDNINSVYEKCSESQVQRPQKIKKKIFQCPKCEHTATQRGNLRRHIAGVHEAERKYKCQQCDHKTAQKSNLQIHIKLKHEGKRLPCPHCNHIAKTCNFVTYLTKVFFTDAAIFSGISPNGEIWSIFSATQSKYFLSNEYC